jgi:hypothetical protein
MLISDASVALKAAILEHAPEVPERTLALRRLQEAMFWADEALKLAPVPEPTPIPETPAERLARVVEAGRTRIGDPYVWNGEEPGGFDCSGFVTWCYRQVGVEVPSFTDAAWDACQEIFDPLHGDLTFYEYTDPKQAGVRFPHMGLFLSTTEVLDSRGGVGVGVHPHVAMDRRYGRVQALGSEPVPAPEEVDPWKFFAPEDIAAATECSLFNVMENWPHLAYALDALGIRTRECEAAAIATVAVETASSFRPIHEFRNADGSIPSYWYNYTGGPDYHGRGYIQLTHSYNYATYGDLVGRDLVNHPDDALEPSVAAWVLAYYFRERGVAQAAFERDWTKVRRLVVGWVNNPPGLDRLVTICERLIG